MGIKTYALRYERGYADKCELTYSEIFYATNMLKKISYNIYLWAFDP